MHDPGAGGRPCPAGAARHGRRRRPLPALRRSVEVWILSTGEAKAAAVAMALGGAGEVAIPVGGATGTRRTLWLLDRAAAAKLPRDLTPRIA